MKTWTLKRFKNQDWFLVNPEAEPGEEETIEVVKLKDLSAQAGEFDDIAAFNSFEPPVGPIGKADLQDCWFRGAKWRNTQLSATIGALREQKNSWKKLSDAQEASLESYRKDYYDMKQQLAERDKEIERLKTETAKTISVQLSDEVQTTIAEQSALLAECIEGFEVVEREFKARGLSLLEHSVRQYIAKLKSATAKGEK